MIVEIVKDAVANALTNGGHGTLAAYTSTKVARLSSSP